MPKFPVGEGFTPSRKTRLYPLPFLGRPLQALCWDRNPPIRHFDENRNLPARYSRFWTPLLRHSRAGRNPPPLRHSGMLLAGIQSAFSDQWYRQNHTFRPGDLISGYRSRHPGLDPGPVWRKGIGHFNSGYRRHLDFESEWKKYCGGIVRCFGRGCLPRFIGRG